ncbi:MAG: M48 family metallopeptidase [Candidatus Omnitrophica bacterium]|nr:M48 family metallopeptidase [Candidatus Omnitrophota bacterium]
MKFVPKEIKNNVNISSKRPLGEFFLLLAGILGIVILIYIALGFTIDLVVSKLPPQVEGKLGKIYTDICERARNPKFSQIEAELKRILYGLIKHTSWQNDCRVYVRDNDFANAYVLPGNNIVVTTALLKELNGEDEVAFVLAHELGHFVNRDHLRGLGRRLIFFIIAVSLGLDEQSEVILSGSLQDVEMKFSQTQERKADLFALQLLNKAYGNVRGAVEFFEKLKKWEKGGRFLYFFASHPSSLERIRYLKEEIIKNNYEEKEIIPWKKFEY